MSGDNTHAQKAMRAYNHLLCAIIENKPQRIIDALLGEANFNFRDLELSLDQAKKDAEEFYTHYQGGRTVLVKKDSPLGKILAKGKLR